MLASILTDNLPGMTQVFERNKVKRAFAFGSVTSPRFNKESDVDILISFEDGMDPIEYGENYFKVLYSLQDLLQREVDLVTERSLKNPYFIEEVNRTKVALYE
ncbi:MAG: nucleotidyltransferase domain-containing protein [Cyclobacteriaceae bacterium]|nr:nucleotidyltransferase domain-containing protein [Cyclobacteriaceae bacterium]